MTNLIEQSKMKSERLFQVSLNGTMKSCFETIYASIKEKDELKFFWEIQRSLDVNDKSHYIKKVTFRNGWERRERWNRYNDDTSFENAIIKIQKQLKK